MEGNDGETHNNIEPIHDRDEKLKWGNKMNKDKTDQKVNSNNYKYNFVSGYLKSRSPSVINTNLQN